jgi:hypothetical protein
MVRRRCCRRRRKLGSVGQEASDVLPGFYVQPEFFVYQHRLRRSLLEMVQEVFECGRIFPKPGNPDVLVFAIQSRPLISERVLPFTRQYMTFSSRRADLDLFETALALFDEGFHRTP